jgi:hypothetical protein
MAEHGYAGSIEIHGMLLMECIKDGQQTSFSCIGISELPDDTFRKGEFVQSENISSFFDDEFFYF